MMKTSALLLLASVFLVIDAHSQQQFTIDENNELRKVEGTAGVQRSHLIINDAVVHESSRRQTTAHQTVSDHYIVTFKEKPPLLEEQNGSGARSIPYSQVSDRFDQLRSDIEQIHTNTNARSNSTEPAPEIMNEYYRALYGAHIIMSKKQAFEISKLAYISSVKPSKKYAAILDRSVPLIGADSFWETYGSKGAGMVVGIIDTGIDYNHPALGGGIGDQFKVLGGYDFVNDDADPMDDHFHGTHVAGIVAGNGGTIQGVAPEASLMALKVLDAGGSGWDYQIIQAIEWSVDPNGDGDTSDKLDVVNMSLGGYGDYQDPMSLAVDNAVNLGVVYCIAAGNNYRNFQVSSPGTAELAITVGASDFEDQIATFSSKGPNRGNYHIKPDILAPGVAIYSSMLNEEYANLSGTSMAAPHIAGVAALLLSTHTTWGPMEVKSALTTTAINLGMDIMDQGSGRVDVPAAAEIMSLVYPSNLSFGLNDIKSDEWNPSVSLTITNASANEQTYSVVLPEVQNGLSLAVSESNFSLAAGSFKELVFSLRVDNQTFELEAKPSQSYSDFISIRSENDELNIPWAFVSGSLVTLRFDQWSWDDDFLLIGDSVFVSSWDHEVIDGEVDLLVPSGTYDLLVTKNFARMIIVKETIEVDRHAVVEVRTGEAKNQVKLTAENESGDPLKSENVTSDVMITSEDGITWIYGNGLEYVDEYLLSDFSERYNVSFRTMIAPTNSKDQTVYDINYGYVSGLRGDTSFHISGEELIHTELLLNPPVKDSITLLVVFDMFFAFNDSGNPVDAFGGGSGISDHPYGKWFLDLYTTGQVVNRHNRKMGLSVYAYSGNYQYDEIADYELMVHNITAHDGQVGAFRTKEPGEAVAMVNDGDRMEFGNGLVHPDNVWANYQLIPWGQFNETMYYDQAGFSGSDWQNGQDIFTFYGDLHYEWMNGPGSFEYKIFSEENLEYYNFKPILQSLQLINSEGKVVSGLTSSASSAIRYSIRHDPQAGLADSKLYLKLHSSVQYDTLAANLQFESDSLRIFQAELPTELEDGHYDLLITAKHQNDGDSMQWKMEPGFAISQNARPEIQSQLEVILGSNQTHAFEPHHIHVYDLDNVYPNDFTSTIESGDHYTIEKDTIKPQSGFSGNLSVPMTVSDGMNESEVFYFGIAVMEKAAPKITGQKEMSIWKNEWLQLSLQDIEVEYQEGSKEDLILNILEGDSYWISGSEIIPYYNFTGELAVNISVSDGELQSDEYQFIIEVTNYIPEITGQAEVNILKGETYKLSRDDMYIDDMDDWDFHLIVQAGNEYSHEGLIITPDEDFAGKLNVNVQVSDGMDTSAVFLFYLYVEPPTPWISDQVEVMRITRSETFALTTDQLILLDDDNFIPEHFLLNVSGGENYIIENSYTIIPAPDFVGMLEIPVHLSDDEITSNEFYYQLNVINQVPVISSQEMVSISPNQSYTLLPEHVEVLENDSYDRDYLQLEVLPGENYTVDVLSILPEADFEGELTVPVTVSDGFDVSEPFDFKIQVKKVLSTDPSYRLKLFPVPADEYVILQLPGIDEPVIEIYDISGVQLLKYSSQNNLKGHKLDISSFDSGIYLLLVSHRNGAFTKKLIKH